MAFTPKYTEEEKAQMLKEHRSLTNVGLLAEIIKRRTGQEVTNRGMNPKTRRKGYKCKEFKPVKRPYIYHLTVELKFLAKSDYIEGINYKKTEDHDIKYMVHFINRHLANKNLNLIDITAIKNEPIDPFNFRKNSMGANKLPFKHLLP